MSSLAFLVTELQSLASETRRKHPEIREAAEKSLAILRSSPEQATANLASDGPQSDDLLRPVFMGCATKNAKVVAISLGSLQRLINLKAVPQSAVALIIKTMDDSMNQGVDIQLRILQTLLSLVTNFPAVHGALLGDALLLCFKLQESRIAVVSSTAAATLRQLVMFVVDKVVEEDRNDHIDPQFLSETTLPDGSILSLAPSARDAFSVFEDFCLLANSEKPHFLKLSFLQKTFALELIESVLTNYHDLFRRHEELLLLLRHHLCPLLLKSLSDRPVFPLTLRCTRVVFLLLKQFSFELETEAEVFLMLLIKIIGEDHESSSGTHGSELPTMRPPWMRVVAMEIMRGLCSDAELMRNVWARYDSQSSGSNVFTSLISALKRLVTEKPAVLGVGSQIFGVGVQSSHQGDPPTSHYGLDVGGVAGMVATAASATVSGVVGMMQNEVGLSLQGSAMKLQCIDQLDKADAPPIPESYLYLLAVQCLVSLCEGFASFTGPLYTSIVMQKPRTAGEPPIHAPPALDLTTLPADDKAAQQLRIVRDMVENGWPALLAALSFVIATNLSDELFVDVLASYQAVTNVSGMLALTTPRDAFFTSLAKFAIPTRVVSSVDSYIEPPTPRTASSLSENLGLSGPVQAPGLSERNMACLKVLVSNAMFLAGSLGESWYGVLEALQNADYVLTSKGIQSTPPKRSGSTPSQRNVSTASSGGNTQSTGATSQQLTPRHPLLADLDSDSLLNAIQHLFNASKNLEDGAFSDFVKAICRLSAEMVGMQTDGGAVSMAQPGSGSTEDLRNVSSGGLSPIEPAHRRRVSGIHLPRTLRSGDFGINKLGGVLMLNIHRLIHHPPEIAWKTSTTHLLSIIRLPLAPQPIRTQAARALDEILIVVPRNLTTTGDLQAQVQRRVLDVLAQQVIPDNYLGNAGTSTSVELRRMGLETLHQILQASGHTLVVGWETIFEMLSSVCKPAPPLRSNSIDLTQEQSLSVVTPGGKPLPLGYNNEKGYTSLVKIAFQSLTLVCDSVSSLSPSHLRLCISTLGHFGRQSDTNIALTAAESLLWSVSDAIQAKRKDADQEPEYSALWMFLLLEVLRICTDTRPELRVGAIQTLFRTMQLYGGTLSLDTWEECIWKVTFPLVDSITSEIRHHAHVPPGPDSASVLVSQAWDESKILALQSIGSIFHDFLTSKIMRLSSFTKAWDFFVSHIQDSVLLDNRVISAPALRCLEKAVKASAAAEPDLKSKVTEAKERVWETCDEIGNAVERVRNPISPTSPSASSKSHRPFTQESLVAFVDVIRSTRNVSRVLDGTEWQLDRLTRLMAILKGVITYPSSPDYRSDIDSLTPVQSVTMETIESIDLSTHGSPSLVMGDLSEYATLPFIAAFDVPPTIPPQPQSQASGKPSQKRITYIALAKKVMPMLVDLFLGFKRDPDIYEDGTLEAIFSAYSIPIKLKYDCPAPSKFGNDPPLWKTASTCFLTIVKECSLQMRTLGKGLSHDRIEGIWHQVLDVFRGGILADCSATSSFTLSEQESEENFDLALLSSLEIDVVPHLGDVRVPDELAAQLARVLQKGSRVYEDGVGSSPPSSSGGSFEKVDLNAVEHERDQGYGTTDLGTLVPRERFSYWCLDLLFLICSDTTQDQEPSRRRLATLSIPSLLERCRTTLVGYVADEALRGNLPFPRAREDELIYILRKLLDLRLWPGTLWAAFSDAPSKYCIEQPSMDVTQPPSVLISDAVKRSSIAHLFHFYGILCNIASLPRKMPSAWVLSEASPNVSEGEAARTALGENTARMEEHDARALARACLKLVGKEMGVIS